MMGMRGNPFWTSGAQARRAVFVCLLAAAASVQTLTAASVPADWSSCKVWYRHPAARWEEAFPVGNGRLGAMVFGRTGEERIALNEETYWTGGPYDPTVPGAAGRLGDIRRLIFQGESLKAHRLFGRTMMGFPVEQQKYQALGDLLLRFPSPESGEASDYRHELDLDRAVVTTSYALDGVRFVREVFVSPLDQVVVVRIEADRPGRVAFRAQLRGVRNQAHSNYATDYFRMDALGGDGLVLRGRSADYLGVPGRLRYEARLLAVPQGGVLTVEDDALAVSGADAVTLFVAAATSFVSYKDVSADPAERTAAALAGLSGKAYPEVKEAHVGEHRRLFRRVWLDLPRTPAAGLPTDERLAAYEPASDPDLAALAFQFGRYLLISSSRPGTQPANLQGLWNESASPPWDSKYTTNINLEMNYWPAEPANLAECHRPLIDYVTSIREVSAKNTHRKYGKVRGWTVQTMNNACGVSYWKWNPPGSAWYAQHLWEHFAFGRDRAYLRETAYPVLKEVCQFWDDHLKRRPDGTLVTYPACPDPWLVFQRGLYPWTPDALSPAPLLALRLSHC